MEILSLTEHPEQVSYVTLPSLGSASVYHQNSQGEDPNGPMINMRDTFENK